MCPKLTPSLKIALRKACGNAETPRQRWWYKDLLEEARRRESCSRRKAYRETLRDGSGVCAEWLYCVRAGYVCCVCVDLRVSRVRQKREKEVQYGVVCSRAYACIARAFGYRYMQEYIRTLATCYRPLQFPFTVLLSLISSSAYNFADGLGLV